MASSAVVLDTDSDTVELAIARMDDIGEYAYGLASMMGCIAIKPNYPLPLSKVSRHSVLQWDYAYHELLIDLLGDATFRKECRSTDQQRGFLLYQIERVAVERLRERPPQAAGAELPPWGVLVKSHRDSLAKLGDDLRILWNRPRKAAAV